MYQDLSADEELMMNKGGIFLKTEIKEARLLMENPIPSFQYGNQKFCFLNLGLEVEMDGVIYHLHSEFSEKAEMGAVIDTIEMERSKRQTA